MILLLAACNAAWKAQDNDGDGIAAIDGDCWDHEEGPVGSGLTGADIYPDAPDAWYDGVDANCAGNDDFDADGDGFVPDEYQGEPTTGVAGSGDLPAGDCWDDPNNRPVEMEALHDMAALPANAVYPDATERWYDGIDQDCAGDSDFDQDEDGFATAWWANRDGEAGTDCFDAVSDVAQGFVNDANLEPAEVRPDATDIWYDGTDQNCDGNEYDQDWDGYDFGEECDDTDPDVFPNTKAENWDNCVDENCDGNAGDQDSDGYVTDAHVALCANWQDINPGRGSGDCWDDATTIPEDYTAIRGPQPSAQQTNPGALETYYDAVDQDCDGASDFDADRDGEDTEHYTDRTGGVGVDCYDDATDAFDNPAGLAPHEVYTSAAETWYDGTDQNCDGASDYDQDADGYDSDTYGGADCCDNGSCGGVSAANINPGEDEQCSTSVDEDCDGDTNDPDGIGAAEFFADQDGDGFGDSGDSVFQCGSSTDYPTTDDNDCDDGRNAVNPSVDETCTTFYDDNCDGVTNEQNAAACTTYYRDDDNDGYGHATDSECWCEASGDYEELNNDDCDDSRFSVNPSASETCNTAYDDDCNGSTNDEGATSCTWYYNDIDGDNYGHETDRECWCAASGTYDQTDNDDCNDSNVAVNPSATEDCSTTYDDDCSGNSNEEDADNCTVFYRDNDNDGYGHETTNECWCSATGSYDVTNNDDCNDSRSWVNPGETESCSTSDDDNCSGSTNEQDAFNCNNYPIDDDGDGYGHETNTECWCSVTSDLSTSSTDCNDSDPAVNPSNNDNPSVVGQDDDCDEAIDEGAVAEGDVILTEFLVYPESVYNDEWFELMNVSSNRVFLDGWQVYDSNGANAFCVSADAGLVMDPDDVLVFCNHNSIAGVSCDYTYGSNAFSDFEGCTADSSFTFSTSEELNLEIYDDGGWTVVNDVDWSASWGIDKGVSKELSTNHNNGVENGNRNKWCDAVNEYVTNSFGTPGSDNDCAL